MLLQQKRLLDNKDHLPIIKLIVRLYCSPSKPSNLDEQIRTLIDNVMKHES
jgi:hypothetical protein